MRWVLNIIYSVSPLSLGDNVYLKYPLFALYLIEMKNNMTAIAWVNVKWTSYFIFFKIICFVFSLKTSDLILTNSARYSFQATYEHMVCITEGIFFLCVFILRSEEHFNLYLMVEGYIYIDKFDKTRNVDCYLPLIKIYYVP